MASQRNQVCVNRTPGKVSKTLANKQLNTGHTHTHEHTTTQPPPIGAHIRAVQLIATSLCNFKRSGTTAEPSPPITTPSHPQPGTQSPRDDRRERGEGLLSVCVCVEVWGGKKGRRPQVTPHTHAHSLCVQSLGARRRKHDRTRSSRPEWWPEGGGEMEFRFAVSGGSDGDGDGVRLYCHPCSGRAVHDLCAPACPAKYIESNTQTFRSAASRMGHEGTHKTIDK